MAARGDATLPPFPRKELGTPKALTAGATPSRARPNGTRTSLRCWRVTRDCEEPPPSRRDPCVTGSDDPSGTATLPGPDRFGRWLSEQVVRFGSLPIGRNRPPNQFAEPPNQFANQWSYRVKKGFSADTELPPDFHDAPFLEKLREGGELDGSRAAYSVDDSIPRRLRSLG